MGSNAWGCKELDMTEHTTTMHSLRSSIRKGFWAGKTTVHLSNWIKMTGGQCGRGVGGRVGRSVGPEATALWLQSAQFSSVAQSCPTLYDPMNHSTPGLPVHHQLLEFTQTHAHQVSDAIQPSHPLSSPSPPSPNPSQGFFQRVNSSHEVAKVLEFQLRHQYKDV